MRRLRYCSKREKSDRPLFIPNSKQSGGEAASKSPRLSSIFYAHFRSGLFSPFKI